MFVCFIGLGVAQAPPLQCNVNYVFAATLKKMIIAANNCDSTFDSCKYSIQRFLNIKLTLLKYNVIFIDIYIKYTQKMFCCKYLTLLSNNYSLKLSVTRLHLILFNHYIEYLQLLNVESQLLAAMILFF